MKKFFCFVSGAFAIIAIWGCDKQADVTPSAAATDMKLAFSIELNECVYRDSNWGQPPQFAIWLEDEAGEKIRTVWVTHRMGKGNWLGKTECPIALAYWVSRYNKQTHTCGPPTLQKPVADAITGATPKKGIIVQTEVPIGSRWKYFIEVNVSGDFNAHFPSQHENGVQDIEGNGQPSLIYQGYIEAAADYIDTPKLIGRTGQFRPIDDIITDLSGITTAKNLFSKIEARCRPK